MSMYSSQVESEICFGRLSANQSRGNREHNCTYLVKATFYDSLTFDYLYEMKIDKRIEGDIETHRLSINIDRDILNIVSQKGVSSIILSYRLKEIENIDVCKSRKLDSGIEHNSDSSDCQSEDNITPRDTENTRNQDRRIRNSHRQAHMPRRYRSERSLQNSVQSESDSRSSDEWTP
ncbi:hypothetical protein SK128_001766 [Halocaridina rubra]|uniref:Uncharacterized protein n=1 Tax=Halocaridina rubra TaxID=373956 RepID=A0AAN8WNN9_HALRR